MQRHETWLAAGLLTILALVVGGATQTPTVFFLQDTVVVQPQKEADAMKLNSKNQYAQGGGPPGGRQDAPGDGLPDPGPGNVISPLAADAIALARSKVDADHARLARLLVDEAWLDRLDPPAVARGIDPRFLQLTRVLEAAAREALQTLEAPASHALYRKSGWRQAALIEASGAVARPGPKLIALWLSQLKPEAVELETTIRALVRSRGQVAMRLLEDAFASNAFSNELVISWFRDPVLQHRQDPELLASLERMLQARRLNPRRRAALVEAIFEYRPTDWYISTDSPPTPPRRADLTEATRVRLRSIADRAARDGLIDPARRAQIEAELAPPPPPTSQPR